MPEPARDPWPDVERLYYEALERDADARDAFLVEACAGNEVLRAEVASLLKFDTAARSFLTRPALEQAARTLTPTGAGSLAGRQIHGYEVRALLGAGGMGEVYLARDLRLGRDVALKILRRSAAGDQRYLRRFEDEARSASILNHPNIVTIYGVGEDGDISYIAMERVHGRTLREIVAAADLAIPAVLDLAVQLADALAVAHDNGIVHRDLKPDNVMVTPEGLLKVLDFGIAKREGVIDFATTMSDSGDAAPAETLAGTILGTVGYMSPEQAAGRRATPASDQFSFGAMLYEMLTGRRAFERGSKAATLEAIRQDQPAPIESINANVTMPLRRVIERCLEKDPALRYARSRDLAAELREIRERAAGRGLSRRQAIWLGAGAVAAVASAAGFVWWQWPRGPRVQSIALLPFDNVDQDPGIDHLCNGLTEDLILRIGSLPIRVMPHSLVSNFKRGGDPLAFGRSIGADSVLTGTVLRRANELTIAATLTEVASGKPLWSYSRTTAASDLQRVQDAIAVEIANDGISLRLSREDRDRLVRHATSNAEAYELYLQGVYLHEQMTRDGYLEARDLFARAVALDPAFAVAHAALAATYSASAIDGYEPPAECWPACYRALRDALKRDADLPDAHAVNASYEFFYNWDWDAADREWALAMRARSAEMFPPLQKARALQQWALGRTADALRIIREVRVLDRLSPMFIITEANYLRRDNKLDQAAATYETALRAEPDDVGALYGLAEVRRDQGRFAEAIALRRPLDTDRYNDDELEHLLAAANDAEGYRQVELRVARLDLEELEEEATMGRYVAPIDRARLHAKLGDAARAFGALDAALDNHDPAVVMIRVDEAWHSLRTHPRFVAAVKRMKLP